MSKYRSCSKDQKMCFLFTELMLFYIFTGGFELILTKYVEVQIVFEGSENVFLVYWTNVVLHFYRRFWIESDEICRSTDYVSFLFYWTNVVLLFIPPPPLWDSELNMVKYIKVQITFEASINASSLVLLN